MSRLFGGTPVTSRSSMKMPPSSTGSRPASIRRVVDLPQPDGPTSTMNSPSWISRSSPATAGADAPGYHRCAPLKLTVATDHPSRQVSRSHSQAVLGDDLGVPTRRVLERAPLVGEVDPDQTEPLLVPPGPLEVVQQRPDVVPPDVDTLLQRRQDRAEVRLQIVDPVLVVDRAVLDSV